MKVPLEWLKEFVAVRISPKALAERLTLAGLEVVGILESDGQPVLDLEVTPNRADCLSIIGIAREVAVVTGQRLKRPPAQGVRPNARSKPPPASLTIRIEDRQGCPRYLGRLMDGLTVGPSPEWMQRRLLACGARPVNNIVDITNYVLLEQGQPLHAFDFNRLHEGTILVRPARANERLTTLDGVRRTLALGMLVIADARQPVAVAGIMGGMGSEVVATTRTILLESAQFDAVRIRRTARALGLASDSSYRFERGVDPVGVETASARAAALLAELAGGREVAMRDVGTTPAERAAIVIEPKRVSRWLGVPMDGAMIRTTLARLSCRVASGGGQGALHVRPPSFRQDLQRDVDLYEELARIAGYDRVPATLPMASLAPADAPSSYRRTYGLKRMCASAGLDEVVTWSLVSAADLARCGVPVTESARLANPLSQEHAHLRPSLLIGLLQVVRRNLAQGAAGVRLFELGSIFSGAVEQGSLGIALAGMWSRDWRTQEPCDFFRLKGLIRTVVGRWCEGALQWKSAAARWATPGQAAEILLGGRAAGRAGQVAHGLLEGMEIEQDVWYAELSVAGLLEAVPAAPAIRAPTMMPPVKRDLSILVPQEVVFETLDRAIRSVSGALASRVELIDRYTGAQVPAGKTSLTFSIEYRDASRTLTATEVDALHQRIGQMLTTQLNVQLR